MSARHRALAQGSLLCLGFALAQGFGPGDSVHSLLPAWPWLTGEGTGLRGSHPQPASPPRSVWDKRLSLNSFEPIQLDPSKEFNREECKANWLIDEREGDTQEQMS